MRSPYTSQMESGLISMSLLLKTFCRDTLYCLYSLINPLKVPLKTTPAGMSTILDLEILACSKSSFNNTKFNINFYKSFFNLILFCLV